MARVASKRKAEASPAAAPSRNKIPRIALNKKKDVAAVNDDDVDELSLDNGSESSGLFIRERPVGNRKGKQVQNVRIPKVTKATATKRVVAENQGKSKRSVRIAKTAVDEEEDYGRTESQQFLEMVRYGSKKKKDTKKANEYLDSFEKLVKKEQDGLEMLLEEKANEVTKQNDTFLAAFESAYTSTMLKLAPAQGPDSPQKPNALTTEPHKTLDKENRLKKQSEQVLKGASELMAEYEKCEKLLNTCRGRVTIGEKWRDGVEKAKRILEAGKVVGERKAESVMMGTDEIGRDELAGRGLETREGEALYENETEAGAWARVAKKQEKVVKKMTRLLPVD